MKLAFALALSSVIAGTAPSYAEVTFTDLPSYCHAMSEASTPSLLARTQGLSRADAEALLAGMTDPVAIRMVREVIDYAYSRPATTTIDEMRIELRSLCIEKKIFAQ